MVPGVDTTYRPALESRDRTVDERKSTDAFSDRDTGELVDARSGELPGKMMLVGAENVHREMSGGVKIGQAPRFLGRTPGHQRGIQRYRSE